MGITRRHGREAGLTRAEGFALRAAEGWLDLNSPVEASAEIDRVKGPGAACLDVLLLRWRVLAETGHWDGSLTVARAMTRRYPEDVRGWIKLAETFYQLKQFEKAYRVAVSKGAQFPESSTLLHDAACYCCLVAKFETARRLFARANGLTRSRSGGSSARVKCDEPSIPGGASVRSLRPFNYRNDGV
jgi:hypothetical protein